MNNVFSFVFDPANDKQAPRLINCKPLLKQNARITKIFEGLQTKATLIVPIFAHKKKYFLEFSFYDVNAIGG